MGRVQSRRTGVRLDHAWLPIAVFPRHARTAAGWGGPWMAQAVPL